MKQLDSYSQLRRPKCSIGMAAIVLICLLTTPQTVSAYPNFDKGWFILEVVFPDIRLEWDDYGGISLLLSWPIPVVLLKTSDSLAALEFFGEPQLNINNLDFRLASGFRGNWNVFDMLGGLDDTGIIVEAGGVYDDFPAAFAGGGLGARPATGGGVGLVYRRVWTFNKNSPNRHDFCIDYRIYF